jgi:hypothetical protein
VFWDCTGLTAIEVDPSNPAYSSVEGMLFNKEHSTLIQCPGGKSGPAVVPESVTEIREGAFSGCAGLSVIEVDPSNPAYSSLDGMLLDKEGTTLFLCPEGRSGQLAIPEGVTEIGTGAFRGCTRLTELVIGEGVTSIRNYTFAGCTGLTSIVIPGSVTLLGGGGLSWGSPFENCSGLENVFFLGDKPERTSFRSISGADNAVLYHRPATEGWAPEYVERPTALWIPLTLGDPPLAGAQPLRLRSASPAPQTVRVQRSANLMDWEDWATVSRDEGPGELHDAEAGAEARMFYRMVEE